jgi:hypothetical protein
MSKVRVMLVIAAALIGLTAQAVLAGDCCCECGGGCGVRKVCRIVPDKRKIEKTVYGCECSDICLPGHACRSCLNCEEKCGGEEGKCDCCNHRPYALLEWFNWSPNCGRAITVKKLVKYTASKQVCGYKWKVEEVCDHCCPASNCVEAADGTPVEKAPAGVAEDELPPPPVPVATSAFNLSSRKGA